MEIKTLYQLHNWDGGERHNATDYYFETKEVGNEYVAVVDQYANIIPKTLIICSSLEDYKQNLKSELKKRALAKLTKEDRAILGLE